MTEPTIYARLSAPFDVTHTDPRGLTYISGEQCITRLNEVLGVAGWSFSIVQHGYDQEADEMWVHGRLVAWIDSREVVREQFGSQKHNRKRADNAIIDYGFDLKGAGTDCLKKCAMGLGVGLYLSHKEDGPVQQPQRQPARPAPRPQQQAMPQAAAIPPKRNEVRDGYERLLTAALAVGINTADWQPRPAWTDEDYRMEGAALKELVKERRERAAA